MAKLGRSLKDTAKDVNAKEAFIQAENQKKAPATENNTKMLNTRLPVDLIREIKVYCASNDMTIQQFIEKSVRDKLK